MSPRVVISLLTKEQEFQQMQAADAQGAAARLGLEVEVLFAENNAILQIQQLFHHIHAEDDARPAALVVESVVGEGLERVARNAVRAGIGWVLLNWDVAYVEALRGEQPDLLVTSVAADEVEIGRIQARQVRALLPGGGTVLCVQGPPDTSTSRGRARGLEEGLAESGVQVRQALHGDWTEASGEKAVNAWLRLKTSEGFRPDIVVCQNDAMALGARAAIRAMHPDWGVPLTGCDGLPSGGQQLVEKGELVATVVKPTTTGPALELVARALAGDVESSGVVLAPTSCPSEEKLAAREGGSA